MKKPLNIGILAPPWESCPPKKYGGTERIIGHLCDGLVKKGHRVTLFASGDSKTRARLQYVFPRALYRAGIPWNDAIKPLSHASLLLEHWKKFDIINNHFHYYGLLFARYINIPLVTTYHGDFVTAEKNPDRKRILEHCKSLPFITISKAQKHACGTKLRFVNTIYNGIDVRTFPFQKNPKKYLAWFGRFADKKGAHDAIAAAKRLKMKIILAGKVDPIDRSYFSSRIRPKINNRDVVYIGELNDRQKKLFLKNARALLFPITWNEPFGLVMPEAMACGTPVIAYRNGSVPEIVAHKKTGFVVNASVASLISAVKNIGSIERKICRKHVQKHFDRDRMVDEYEKTYYRLLFRSYDRKT